jgi:hypothetical protein
MLSVLLTFEILFFCEKILFPLPPERLSKNAKIPFDELRVSGKILSKWISNRSG